MNNGDRIPAVNREAVACLERRRNRDAFALLNQGLRAMLLVIQERQDDNHYLSTGLLNKETMVSSVPLTSSPTDMSYSPDNFFQFYEAAFVISDDKEKMNRFLFQDVAAATLMYNTGLLFHRQGNERGDYKMLKRALYMYEMATSLLQQGSGQEADNLLMLALTNNMGHIHSHFFEKDKVLLCREIFESLIYEEITAINYDEGASHFQFFLECLQYREFGLTVSPAA